MRGMNYEISSDSQIKEFFLESANNAVLGIKIMNFSLSIDVNWQTMQIIITNHIFPLKRL